MTLKSFFKFLFFPPKRNIFVYFTTVFFLVFSGPFVFSIIGFLNVFSNDYELPLPNHIKKINAVILSDSHWESGVYHFRNREFDIWLRCSYLSNIRRQMPCIKKIANSQRELVSGESVIVTYWDDHKYLIKLTSLDGDYLYVDDKYQMQNISTYNNLATGKELPFLDIIENKNTSLNYRGIFIIFMCNALMTMFLVQVRWNRWKLLAISNRS